MPDFLGVGWAFPPGVTPAGQTATASHEEDVRQAILIILGTDPGERVMRPDFGAGLSAFVFEPVTPVTLAGIEDRVRESLITWEPRIDVESVACLPERSRVDVEIRYRVRATNTLHNLVYPFYLEEGAGR
ncbi:GPW/gp25 family protein [Nonomuraea jiangxiensis]|uniref:IraD/Gp25-like domain-containing protein n=1 Tax=Nonomuraea jiangxiensis TaxID=633440 RepID=A0A1G9EXF5_9ACTN|nr:GPW/gp25 family protein [Nonomuraea jiangxiensis]SDK80834.1 hypothetical protein SAMN05421869_11950 [Nonomuraea jiangxiensis]